MAMDKEQALTHLFNGRGKNMVRTPDEKPWIYRMRGDGLLQKLKVMRLPRECRRREDWETTDFGLLGSSFEPWDGTKGTRS